MVQDAQEKGNRLPEQLISCFHKGNHFHKDLLPTENMGKKQKCYSVR